MLLLQYLLLQTPAALAQLRQPPLQPGDVLLQGAPWLIYPGPDVRQPHGRERSVSLRYLDQPSLPDQPVSSLQRAWRRVRLLGHIQTFPSKQLQRHISGFYWRTFTPGFTLTDATTAESSRELLKEPALKVMTSFWCLSVFDILNLMKMISWISKCTEELFYNSCLLTSNEQLSKDD